MKVIRNRKQSWIPYGLFSVLIIFMAQPGESATYYVSSSGGDDGNNGTSPGYAFRTIGKINALSLVPGDSVLFRCGEVWRGEILRITRSGAVGNPITYGSYPDVSCADRPVLAGTQLIRNWTLFSGSIWSADLSAGVNAGLFPNGVNQLFRDGSRLTYGRWPNLNTGDGYATVASQPSGTQITCNALPAVNWAGATAHIRGMRWYILNRDVTSSSGNTLTLNSTAGCWGGSCAQWGFFLNGHLSTLDQEGEWYQDASSRRIYLFTATDPNSSRLEGSVIITGESAYMGGIILGRHLQEHVSYVTVENLELRGWFDNGITTPVNLEKNEHSDIRLRNLVVRDVDGTGINLAAWVWNAAANGNGYDGWRGGRNIEISNCLIERANEYGINSYARQSVISRNTLRDIARIGNVGRAGIGCSTTDGEGQCTEPGDGIRIKVDNDGTYSGNNVTIELNRLERIGYNGMDIFGYQNTVQQNLIDQACITKGDCGALRLFGSSNLASSVVHDITIQDNIFLNTIGNTDGAHPTYRPRMGFGLYIDNYSRNVSSLRNTIAGSATAGILYQNSSGRAEGNILHNNSAGTLWSQQITLTSDSNTTLTALRNNVMVGFLSTAGTMSVRDAAQVGTSDQNDFYHASRNAHITVSVLGQDRTLAQWRTYAGKDAQSTEWIHSSIARSTLFFNDRETSQSILLSGSWSGLNGDSVPSPLVLSPFTSKVLIPAVSCQVNIFPIAQTFTIAGGSGTTNVMIGSNCSWSAASNASWITIVSGGTGTGMGTVSFQVDANMGGTRNGTLAVAGQTVSVTQEGAPSVLTLKAGWNWVSFNQLPVNRSLNAFFAPILNQIEQVKTQTQSAVYSNGEWVGDLADMSGISQGIMFKIKVKQACTLTSTGQSLAVNQPIALGANWNWAAFLASTPKSITAALGSIAAQVQQIKSDAESAVYSNGVWSGTLTHLEPGRGYVVKMNSAGTLVYPAP